MDGEGERTEQERQGRQRVVRKNLATWDWFLLCVNHSANSWSHKSEVQRLHYGDVCINRTVRFRVQKEGQLGFLLPIDYAVLHGPQNVVKQLLSLAVPAGGPPPPASVVFRKFCPSQCCCFDKPNLQSLKLLLLFCFVASCLCLEFLWQKSWQDQLCEGRGRGSASTFRVRRHRTDSK